jgi:hypothetical protein
LGSVIVLALTLLLMFEAKLMGSREPSPPPERAAAAAAGKR